MENDILGERLKGLYAAIEHLTGDRATQVVISEELREMTEAVLDVTELLQQTQGLLDSAAAQRDEYHSSNMELIQLRAEVIEEKAKLARTAKDRITGLQKLLQQTEDERDRLKTEMQKQEKQLKDLSEEFGKLRYRMKQYRTRRKAYGEAEERICKMCQKVYLENENYNWSCRTHQSEFGEDMWWCCGKPGKDAPGCRISKHESKEEDEEAELSKREQEALRRSFEKCASCREYGHKARNCPKDPNFRSKCDLAEEATRLEKISCTKLKQSLPSPEFSALALNTLLMRSDMDEFNDEDPATSNSESIISGEDEEALLAFPDIREMKSHVPKQRSLVSLEPVSAKETEKSLSIRVQKSMSKQSSPRSTATKISSSRLFAGYKSTK